MFIRVETTRVRFPDAELLANPVPPIPRFKSTNVYRLLSVPPDFCHHSKLFHVSPVAHLKHFSSPESPLARASGRCACDEPPATALPRRCSRPFRRERVGSTRPRLPPDS